MRLLISILVVVFMSGCSFNTNKFETYIPNPGFDRAWEDLRDDSTTFTPQEIAGVYRGADYNVNYYIDVILNNDSTYKCTIKNLSSGPSVTTGTFGVYVRSRANANMKDGGDPHYQHGVYFINGLNDTTFYHFDYYMDLISNDNLIYFQNNRVFLEKIR
ncbi:hypothetical protein OAA15_00535 [bacterium]|nr:hypothetical protein [bacterium]